MVKKFKELESELMFRSGSNLAHGVSDFVTVRTSDNGPAGSKAKAFLSVSHTTKPFIIVIIIVIELMKPIRSGRGRLFLEAVL